MIERRNRIYLPQTGAATVATGDDGYFKAGNPRVTRFVDNGNGTVSDRATGLMWIKDPPTSPGAPFNATMSWTDALTNIATLNGSGFAGFTDWRLPNVMELISIQNFADPSGNGRHFSPLVYQTASPYFYWSSTTYARTTTQAFASAYNSYTTGVAQGGAKTTVYYVRPVRGGRLNANWPA